MIGNSLRFDVVGELTRMLREQGRAADPVLRQELARVVHPRTRARAAARAAARRSPAGRPSVSRRFGAQAAVVAGVDRRGPSSVCACSARRDARVHDEDAAYWRSQLLARFGGSIGGGTDEIHHNHVAERVLGLPPEPRVDRRPSPGAGPVTDPIS